MISRAILFAVLYCPTVLLPAPSLTITDSLQLSFPTKKGILYQLERKSGNVWLPLENGILGTGKIYQIHLPRATYRLVQPRQKWVQVWSDEFDGDTLDLSKWSYEENNYGGGNNERQAYRIEEKYCRVKDGSLHLSVYRDAHTTSDGKTQPYSSARLRSLGRGEWTFGRFEVRAKVPAGSGMWPAVWMLPSKPKYGPWPASGEIDILESRGSRISETTGALHFGPPWPDNTFMAHAYQFPGGKDGTSFHLYTLEWSAEEIKWFVDKELAQTRIRTDWFTPTQPKSSSAPFDQPFHLLLNLAVDGKFFEKTNQSADQIPASAFPQTFLIDYVRVSQWAD